MNAVTIHGVLSDTTAQSLYMICREKGFAPAIQNPQASPDHPEYRKLNPFWPGPAIEHQGLTLYDPQAAARYIDDLSHEHPLTPKSSRERALMTQWVGNCVFHLKRDIVDDYLKRPAIGKIGLGGVVTNDSGRAMYDIGIVNAALARTAYLAGDQVSLADFFLYPIIAEVCRATNGDGLITAWPDLRRWRQDMVSRDSAHGMHTVMNCSPAVYPKVAQAQG